MLGKLIKYELMAEWKKYAMIFVGLVFLALSFLILNRGIGSLGDFLIVDLLSGLVIGAFILLCFAAFVMLFVFTTIRTYKNLFRDEGYLMHTLPVKPWEHIASKVIAFYVWSIATTIVVIISALIAIGDVSWIPMIAEEFKKAIAITELSDPGFTEFWNGLMWYMGICLILYPFLMQIYINFCLAVGSLFNTHKLIMAVVTFIGVNTVSQVISSIVMFIMAGSQMFNEDAPAAVMLETMSSFYIFSAIFCIIIYGAMLWATNFIMNRKLNLE